MDDLSCIGVAIDQELLSPFVGPSPVLPSEALALPPTRLTIDAVRLGDRHQT